MDDEFAPFQKFNTSFIVKNIITTSNKTVNIFHYPIPVGRQRDLLNIPGVGESDIRTSLLKGEILHKLKAEEIIIVFSDIDLLQFNLEQRKFLQASGVINGLQIGASQLSVLRQEDIQLIGTVDGSNTVFTIPSGTFIQTDLYKIIVYVNGVKQFYLGDYFIAESGGPGTGYDIVILTIPPTAIPSPDDVITADYYVDNSS
jgi:hypothetical protein